MKYGIYATVFSLVIGVLVAAAPIIFPDAPFSGKQTQPVMFLLGVLVAFLPPAVIYFYELGAHKQKIDELLFQTLEKGYVGLAPVAEKQLFNDLAKASSVQNTFISLRTPKEQHQKAKTIYQNWLRRRDVTTWEDLISIRELYSGRYTEIKVKNYKPGKHRLFVLKEGVTPLNFIILKGLPNKEADVVYFGWLPSQSRETTKIFKSTDVDLIELFSNYFSVLKDQSWNTELNPSEDDFNGFSLDHCKSGTEKLHSVSPGLVDKQGQWITVAFEKGYDGDFNHIHSIGFVSVEFTGPKVALEPIIYDNSGAKLPDFRATSSSFIKNNLFFTYRVASKDADGICHYQFIRHDTLGPILRGVFCDSASNRRHSLIGFKCNFNKFKIRNLDQTEFQSTIDDAKVRFEEYRVDDMKKLLKPEA